jgi:hypothetical protein
MHAVTLRVTAADDGYRVALLEGDPTTTPLQPIVDDTKSPLTFTLGGDPATPDEVRAFFVKNESANPRFREIGVALGKFLFPEPIREEWNKRRGAANPLHTYLWIVPTELVQLPWELVYHDGTQIALSPETPLLRWHATESKADGPVTWQIALLVVVGSAEREFRLKAQEEVEAIERAVWTVNRVIDLEVMREPPTEEALLEKFESFHPDILHFIGHGSTVTIKEGDKERSEGQLRFESQPRWSWTHEKIRLLLQRAARRPRLVFLNACRTADAKATPDDQNQVRSVAEAFQAEGVPAVIAMQADVRGQEAATYADAFYTRLAAGDTIDVALAAARWTSSANKDLDERKPYLPAAMVCRPVADIVSVPALQAEELNAINGTDAFSIVNFFVDRKTHRRNIFLSCGSPKPAERKSVVVVHGETVQAGEKEVRPGKSSLVLWFLEGCARRRVRIRYVDVAGAEQIGWLELLRIIRDGDPESLALPDREFPQAAFRTFNWGLQHRLVGAEPGPIPEGLPDPIGDGFDERPEGRELGDDFVRRTFGDFRAGLETLAKDAPVVIVLDHFTRGTVGFTPSDFRWLRQHLLVPVISGTVKNVHVVIVLTKKEMEFYELKKHLGASFANIELEDLTIEEFPVLAKEFLKLSLGPTYDTSREWIEPWLQQQAKQWPPNWKLPRLCEVYELVQAFQRGLGMGNGTSR